MRALPELHLHSRYQRREIADLLGEKYGRYWEQGVVRVDRDYLLFVTLDKSGRPSAIRYEDRFDSPTRFQWQSQNQDSRVGRGAKYQNRGPQDAHFHLFVRRWPRAVGKGAAPFVYLGIVRFDSWSGDHPITVWWTLDAPLPAVLASEFTLASVK